MIVLVSKLKEHDVRLVEFKHFSFPFNLSDEFNYVLNINLGIVDRRNSQQSHAILAKQFVMSSARSIILWKHANDAMKTLKFKSLSVQWVWRN